MMPLSAIIRFKLMQKRKNQGQKRQKKKTPINESQLSED